MSGTEARPSRWVLEPLWIAGFWSLPFAAGVLVVLLFIAPPSGAADAATLAVSVALLIAFVGLLVLGAERRPAHPR